MLLLGRFWTSHLSPCLWQSGEAVMGSELCLKMEYAFMNERRSFLSETSSYDGSSMQSSGFCDDAMHIPSTPFQSFPSLISPAISRLVSSPMP